MLPTCFAFAQIDLSRNSLGGGNSGSDASAVASDAAPASPMDLLVDADTYVPPFYRGRALPSAGSGIRLIAIPYFKRADGSYIPTSAIDYTWKQDDRVIGNLSGIGKSFVVLPAAALYGTSEIEVDAQSTDATRSGSATVALASVDSPLVLYEDSPLLGITYFRAINANESIPDTEMSFAVVPYFAEIKNPNDPRLSYSWTVNNAKVSSDPTDPSEITVNAKNSDGNAAIKVSVSQSDNIFMIPTGAWNLTLGTNASNAFTGSDTTKSPFSGQSQ